MKNFAFTKAVNANLQVAKVIFAGFAILAATGLNAQSQSGQGVARISLIHGDVSTQRGDSGDTAAAALNAPVVTGDKISTGDNSRAEVQLDYANVLRLGDHSTATVASLTDKEIQIQVSGGSATYTAFKTSEIRPEVDTTNLSVRPSKGDVSFRIESISSDETEVTVRRGEAEVSTSSGSTNVRKGEMIVVRGSGNDAQYKVEQARDRDDWDKWNDDRDHLIRDAEGTRRTSPYYTGSQDLDAYGHWSEIPDYGSVWVPTVSADWVPYRQGRWVWEPYYGWTWVSYEPWGWAPYHYGRWFYSGASWVWWPGPVGGYGRGYGYGYGRGYYRPVWAPAYVSFFGFGGGIGVGVGFGSFGWLPVGPCDYYRPWYGGYGGRFNQVNVTNIYNYGGRGDRFREEGRGVGPLYQGRGRQYSNLRLAGTDPRIRGAISSVPADRFGSGKVAARGIDQGQFREARLMTGNLPVVPSRENLNASGRAAAPGTFRGAQPQRFFGTNRSAPSTQSFDRQAAQVQQSIQRDGHFTPIRSGEPANGRGLAASGQPGGNPSSRGPEGSNAGRAAQNEGGPNRPNQNSGQGGQNSDRGASPRETPGNQTGRPSEARPSGTDQRGSDQRGSDQQGWRRFSGPGSSAQSSRGGSADTRPDARNTPSNRGIGAQPDGRGSDRGSFPSRGNGPTTSGQGGWQRFPSDSSRGSSANSGRSEGPGNGGNAGWNRGSARESSGSGDGNRGNDRYQGPGNGGGGWDRGPRPESNRGSGPSGDYGRGASRPTLDMRQPVVTPRSSGPTYQPRGGEGGGRVEAPRSSGGGGRSEAPRSSGGGGRSEAPRPAQGGGGGHGGGGGRPSGGDHHR